jgi:glycosyltransferase involved in cell wall biosynthesis
MKLQFFVNASEGSAGGVRAKMFADRFPKDWEIRFNYRPATKWEGILPFIQSALSFRPDIIYVMDTAYTGVLAGYVAKNILRCKLIVDTGDVAYELAKSTGNYSNRQMALIDWVEKLAIKHANFIIVRGSYHKTLLENQGVKHVAFIPDGVDTAAVRMEDSASLRTELGLDSKLVVGTIGTMIWSERHRMCYGWDTIEALPMLKDLPAIAALLIGDGDGRKILETRAQELGVSDRVMFTGQLPYEKMLKYLAVMDVCVSTQSNDMVGMVRTTGKLPLYLAYGKYVIATNVGEAMRVLPEIGCLLPYEGVRDDLHPTRLAEHIRMLAADRDRVKVAAAAFQVAKDNFDYDLLAEKVSKLCGALVESYAKLKQSK